jgi:hypothetical protein
VYLLNYLEIDLDDFGGFNAVAKQGSVPALALFLVRFALPLLHTGVHHSAHLAALDFSCSPDLDLSDATAWLLPGRQLCWIVTYSIQLAGHAA